MRADLFDSLIVTNFPYPIARVYRRVREDRMSREALCAAFQQILTYLGQIQLLDYLSSEAKDDALTAELRNILERPPTAGIWLSWIERIAAVQKKAQSPSILGAEEALSSRATKKKLQTLVELRNRWAHGNAEFKVAAFRRDLFEFMSQISSLHTSSLFCPHTSRMSDQLHLFKATRLQGDYPHPGELEGRSSIALESDHIHVYARETRELLSLHPLALYRRCEHCEEQHYFQFDRIRNRKIVYSAVPGGHEHVSAESYQFLERLFRNKAPNRYKPRLFSIPGEFGNMPRTLGPGDAIGPYRVEELIKIGGMAQVYRVTDTRTNEIYALKILPLEMSRDPVLVMRFDEEAHNLRKLDHKNIVKLHDLGEDFGDRYLVFELATGGTVGSQRCRDLSDLKGSLPEDEILRVGKQVCDALQYIHAQGILHRDLKPGNLLVSGDRVLAADFGIARARGESGMTLTGLPVGTPEYMSPEQVQQEEPDHRSDLYSLGCILYALATGRPPYRSETPLTTAMYHVQASPPRIEDLNPKISTGLCNIIYKLMQKAPRHRHASARELFDDLCAVADDPAGPQIILGQKTPQDKLEEVRARERARARKRLVLTSALFVVVLALSLVGNAVYRSYKFNSLRAEAQAAWEAGPERWKAACAALFEARSMNKLDPALKELLGEIAIRGTLVIEAADPETAFFVTPESWQVHEWYGWPEALKPQREEFGDGKRVASGQVIALPLGNYRAIPEIGGVPRPELAVPVCITQRLYEEGPEGWSSGRRLPPREAIAANLSATRADVDTVFAFAERCQLTNLRFPEAVPEGFRFVSGGPFFRSETNFEDSAERAIQVADGSVQGFPMFKSFRIVEDELEVPFLMALNETTVGEFESWFDRFGDTYTEWMIDAVSVCDGRTNVRKIKDGTRYVPLELQLDYWKDKLPAGVSADEITNSDQLIDTVFRNELDTSRAKWRAFNRSMREMLVHEKNKTLPVGNVGYFLALVYARTHHPIRQKSFVEWLGAEIESARNVAHQMSEFERNLARVKEQGIPQSLFPDQFAVGRRVSELDYAPKGFLELYFETLFYHVFYAAQAPAPEIIAWLHDNEGKLEPPELRRNLKELVEGFARPHQWIQPMPRSKFFQSATISYLRGLVTSETNKSVYPREHCMRWLAEWSRRERDRARHLEALKSKFASRSADAILDDVEWQLRLEFGWSMGWNLPEVRQWEKACRGADDRPYPWGTEVKESVFGTRTGPHPIEQVSDTDQSPHRVLRLGAQVSEWVRMRSGYGKGGQYVKGGNYGFTGPECNAGYLIRIASGQSYRWTGIRVIQELEARQ